MTETPTRCGSIAIVGAPNAGKSTLVNALVGQKVAIVSSKVQTTRTRLMGIATHGAAQLLLIDTPGIFTSTRRRLDRAMVKAAWDGAQDADLIAMVIDSAAGLKADTRAILENLSTRSEPRILILNKVDITAKPKLLTLAAEANELCSFIDTYFIAASQNDGVDQLKGALTARMPESPWHFPEDQLSDTTSRIMAAEITREQIYNQLHKELPYASTVETEKWEERRDGSVAIHHQILIERESQRAIALGKGGAQIKSIGATARANIAELLGRPVHLFLHVKVKEDWAEDRAVYRDSGLDWVE